MYLARLKATGAFYALKAMEKEGLFESGKECVVNNERNIMVGLNSPFIVNLEFAFETKHFVVLALECKIISTQTVQGDNCFSICGKCERCQRTRQDTVSFRFCLESSTCTAKASSIGISNPKTS